MGQMTQPTVSKHWSTMLELTAETVIIELLDKLSKTTTMLLPVKLIQKMTIKLLVKLKKSTLLKLQDQTMNMELLLSCPRKITTNLPVKLITKILC